MSPAHAQPSRRQGLAGAFVLLALLLVALGVFWQQFRYNPSEWGRLTSGPEQAAGPLSGLKVAGLSPLGAGQGFGPGNLSDKIDGKAELYLAAGFQGLFARRYSLAGKPAAWLEVFLYQMKSPEAAYSVYSSQRRTGAMPLQISQHAYRTSNAVFLAKGSDYLKVVAAAATPELQKASLAAAQAYLQAHAGPQPEVAAEAALFPSQGMQAHSVVLLARDAFGMAGLDRVYIATYPQGRQELMAFLSRRPDPAAARARAAAYAKFLRANGGREYPPPPGLPGARLINILGTWELVFSQGSFLAGVRGGEEQGPTAELARRLHQRLREARP